MEWIWAPEHLGKLGLMVALFFPVLAAVLYGLGRNHRLFQRRKSFFFFIGLFGPFVILLWFLFQAVTAYFGLDSLLGALLLLVSFLFLGLGLGFALRHYWSHTQANGPKKSRS